VNFQGKGLFQLGSSIGNDFEVQAFQCPWNGDNRRAVFVGLALKIGADVVSLVKDELKINGIVHPNPSAAIPGLSFSGGTLSYEEPGNECFSFRGGVTIKTTANVWWKHLWNVAPFYFHDMNLEIGETLASNEGVCASRQVTNVPGNGLFPPVDFSKLTSMCGTRRLSGRRLTRTNNTVLKQICQEVDISLSVAHKKCQQLQGQEAFLEACMYDYCATGGIEQFVESAINVAQVAKERAAKKPLDVELPTGGSALSYSYLTPWIGILLVAFES
jgi:hypothetical protein